MSDQASGSFSGGPVVVRAKSEPPWRKHVDELQQALASCTDEQTPPTQAASSAKPAATQGTQP